MKKFLLPGLLVAVVLLFFPFLREQVRGQGGLIGPGNAILCNQLSQASPVTATTTSLMAGVAGKVIVICGWHVTSNQSAVTTFQFEYGTQGGPCTTPTTITPAYSVTSTAPATDHVDYASLSIPAGAQLCVVTTGATVGMQVGVWTAQF
jgi:hypothetical protein